MKFRTAIYAILAVVIVHIIGLSVGLYEIFAAFDIPMHFAGGFVVAMLGIAIHHFVTDKHHFKGTPSWYHYLFVLGFVMLISVAWEFQEYIIDISIGQWFGWPPTQPSIGDTMVDFLMDGLGAILALKIFKKSL